MIRWSRFVSAISGKGLIVPVDHGLTWGPIAGLESVQHIGKAIDHPAINGVIAHKGIIERLAQKHLLHNAGVMIHLNGMTAHGEDPDTKHLLTSVEHAAALGADGVSVQVNFQPDNHAHNLALLGRVVDDAQRCGLVTLAMVYDKSPHEDEQTMWHAARHVMRVAYELGVDAIKVEPPCELERIPELIDGIADDVAVFFSGGSLMDDQVLLELAHNTAASNATGLCVGRNVFQRSQPETLLRQLRGALDATETNGVVDVRPLLVGKGNS